MGLGLGLGQRRWSVVAENIHIYEGDTEKELTHTATPRRNQAGLGQKDIDQAAAAPSRTCCST